MMNKYEYLANLFSERLGGNFDVKYYENSEAKWEDIVKDDMIHGNMLVSGGVTTRAAGSTIETQQLSITFVIPIALDVFSEAVQTIEDVLKDMYGPIGEHSGSILAYSYNYRSDASKIVVNGVDYATVTAYGTLVCYDNAVLATEVKIKLNGEVLNGIISAVYSNLHSTDGVVYGRKPMQENYLNGISATLTVDLIFRKNDTLHLDLMSNIDTNKMYTVEYYNGIVTRTYGMMIVKMDENSIFGDVIKGQIIFGIWGDD